MIDWAFLITLCFVAVSGYLIGFQIGLRWEGDE